MDALFSSGVLTTIVIILVFFIFVGISFFNPFQNKLLNNSYKGLMFAMPFFIIMPAILWQPSKWGFGYANKFENAASNKNFILLFDLKYSSDDAGRDQEFLRVHVVEKLTGKRLCRKMLGEGHRFLFLQNNYFATQSDRDLKIWELPDCKLIHEYSDETLPTLYKEMEVGIDFFVVNPFNMLEISTKNGMKWTVEPLTGELSNTVPIKPTKLARENDFVKMINDKSNDKLKYIANKNDTILNRNISFIEGKIAAIDSISQHYFIISFKTTDKLDPILTCMQFNHQPLWQIDSKSLDASDYFTETKSIDFVEIDGENILTNIGGFLFKLRIQDKSVIWQNRF